jgi:1-aminocyclopropane-1-carboxylate deaminase/D-cysteine desulfhydrase-like pyridoxal-dependent ACC family enzyme
MNWRGRPLRTFEAVVSLIGATTTSAGLVVRAKIDKRKYPTGIEVSDAEMASLNIERNAFHGDWNYVIKPH